MSWNVSFPEAEPSSGKVNCTVDCDGCWITESVIGYEKEDSDLPLPIKDLMTDGVDYALVVDICSGGSSDVCTVNDENSPFEYTDYEGEPCNFIVVAWCTTSSTIKVSDKKPKGKVTK